MSITGILKSLDSEEKVESLLPLSDESRDFFIDTDKSESTEISTEISTEVVEDTEVDEEPKKEFKGLSKKLVKEEKWAKAYELIKIRGFSVDRVAKEIGVSSETVYNWIKKYLEGYRRRLEQSQQVELVSEVLLEIQHLQQHSIHESRLNKDPRLKYKYHQSAIDCTKLKADEMRKTGILPTTPDKLYAVIEENKQQTIDVHVHEERSEEEIKRSIIELVNKSRALV